MTDPELSRLLSALAREPGDDLLWLAVADRLEEAGEAGRAELIRIGRQLRGMKNGRARKAAEARLAALLVSGVRPCVPEFVNEMGMRFALIPAGTFWMGSGPKERDSHHDEQPRREVTLTRPYWLGVFQVTQADYEAVIGSNPSFFAPGSETISAGDPARFPVEQVSWEDAAAFCAALSAKKAEKKAGREYRLPTEAEWEYACRGGLSMHPFAFGAKLTKDLANFYGGHGYPRPVGGHPPNAFGMHDMHGNIWEWCSDYYSSGSYDPADTVDPRGIIDGEGLGHVARGGGWDSRAGQCRSAFRYNGIPPAHRSEKLGFRVAVDFSAGPHD
jgi:uncharacterized protein (TIGR02996 family)